MRDTLGYYKSGIMGWDSPLYITENKTKWQGKGNNLNIKHDKSY